jgi:hypothetical protein
VFEQVRSSRCYPSLDEPGKRHIAWLRAIVDRDAAAMLTNARFLLEHPRMGGEEERGLYLQSAIASAVAMGRIGEARELRDAYVSQLPRQVRDRFALQLVLDHAAQGGAR